MNEYALLAIFFFIALFYSSVGFGGGSSYLAILALVLTDFYEIRTLALIMNVLVVTIGTFVFVRKKVFNWAAFWPFLLLSIPLAFFGARFQLSQSVFFIFLGSVLILSAIMLVLQAAKKSTASRSLSVPQRMSLGGGIGLLSGVVGIGGGIFLSPTLNLIGWRTPTVVASLASLFILVNSLAGIAGLVVESTFKLDLVFAGGLLASVALGGIIGSKFSIRANIHLIRVLTAVLVLYVGLRVVLNYGFGLTI